MNAKKYRTLAMLLALALLANLPTGCGSSGGDRPSLQNIPRYPNATEGASMEKSGPGGITSHTSDLGRQTAISVPQKNGMISVAIQEFTAQGKVNITFMTVGS